MPTEIIVALISTFGGAVLGFIFNGVKTRRSEEKALKILLRRELRSQYCEWKELGYITQLGLMEYTDALSVYMELVGKNDFIETITKGIKELPVK